MFSNYQQEERPKRNYWVYSTIGLVFLILAVGIVFIFRSNSPSSYSPATLFSKERPITGEIFIVTKGRENIKMALVEICAVPEDQVLDWIEQKETKARPERLKAKSKLDFQTDVKQKADSTLKAAESRERKLSDAYSRSVGSGDGKFEAYMDAGSHTSKLRLASIDRDSQLAKAELEYNRWFSAGYYMDGLSQCAVKAKTNSDGKFSIILPDRKKYALAATSRRKILDNEEFYYWFLWVDSEFVSLTNDNLMEENPANKVVEVREPNPAAL